MSRRSNTRRPRNHIQLLREVLSRFEDPTQYTAFVCHVIGDVVRDVIETSDAPLDTEELIYLLKLYAETHHAVQLALNVIPYPTGGRVGTFESAFELACPKASPYARYHDERIQWLRRSINEDDDTGQVANITRFL